MNGSAGAGTETVSWLMMLGAGGFGVLVGWYTYYINRYRKGDVQISDLVSVIGVIGGAGITALFGSGKSDLFGAYGIGLFAGFFSYFLSLLGMVHYSENFTIDWFLDGRRKRPAEPFYIPGDAAASTHPMAVALGQLQLANTSALTGVSEFIAARAAHILQICEQEWTTDKSDCAAFVRDVAARLGVSLTGQANDIVNQITSGDWQPLPDGVTAKKAADAGLFVVCGLRGADQAQPAAHGHVAVVVSGPLAQDKYPTAYWGKLGAVGERNQTINYAWKVEDLPRVKYAAKNIS